MIVKRDRAAPASRSARTSCSRLDVAATEFYSDGVYSFEGKKLRTPSRWPSTTPTSSTNYPLVSIEDRSTEDDWDGWNALTDALGAKVQLVGDDLFVTNPERLPAASSEDTANALLVKVNQIGTLTETLDAVNLAHRSGYRCMMIHRSGETEDTTIADLAVATNCGQIKTGAPARVRARREVQPAAAHRGRARRRRAVRGSLRLPAVTRAEKLCRSKVPRRAAARPAARDRARPVAGRGAPRPAVRGARGRIPAQPRGPEPVKSPGSGPRSYFTRRAAVFAAVLFVVAMTVAIPAQRYVAQRQNIADLRSQVAPAPNGWPSWRSRWPRRASPTPSSARPGARLHFVMPGELAYRVTDPMLVEQEKAARPTPTTPSGTGCSAPSTRPRNRSRNCRHRAVPAARVERRAWPRAGGRRGGRRPARPPAARRRRRRAPLPVRAARRRPTRPRLTDGTPFPTTFYLTCPQRRVGDRHPGGRPG